VITAEERENLQSLFAEMSHGKEHIQLCRPPRGRKSEKEPKLINYLSNQGPKQKTRKGGTGGGSVLRVLGIDVRLFLRKSPSQLGRRLLRMDHSVAKKIRDQVLTHWESYGIFENLLGLGGRGHMGTQKT